MLKFKEVVQSAKYKKSPFEVRLAFFVDFLIAIFVDLKLDNSMIRDGLRSWWLSGLIEWPYVPFDGLLLANWLKNIPIETHIFS